MIDLHLHTTESDGRLSPRALVDRAAGAGVSVLAATDHDTTAGVAEVKHQAAVYGIEAVSGIEITAVDDGADIHVLGYFVDTANEALQAFLARQRAQRVDRVRALGERLAQLGMPVDVESLIEEGTEHPARSIGRPQVARALVVAGHAANIREAFDRWLGQGKPAFVARAGAGSENVIKVLHEAGGLASLAHPGRAVPDARVMALGRQGLDALEAFHPGHDEPMARHYIELAASLGLLLTGGSDFHGNAEQGLAPGSATLPPLDWQRLSDARDRHARR